MIHRSNVIPLAVALVAAFALPANGVIVSGQVDDFENGTAFNWQAGAANPDPPTNVGTGGPAGVNDNYLRITSNGSFSAGGKLVVFNGNQWAGDYLAANVASIQMQVNNFGPTDLVLRLLLFGPFGQNLTTATPANVAAGSGWQTIAFSLAPASMTGSTYADVMSGVRELNLMHSPNVVLDRRQSPPIVAQLGVDNITAVAALPQTPTWSVDANGNWSQAGNWTADVPNAPGSTAVLGNIISAPRTVTVDTPITVGRIDFDNANSFTVAGANPLTLDATANGASIHVDQGTHSISAPLMLADDTAINIAPVTSTLSITQPISAATAVITKAGPGTLALSSINVAGLSIDEGLVRLSANSGTSLVNALSLAAPGNLNNQITEPLGGLGIQAVPEPATHTLLAIALTAALGRAAASRRKRRKAV